MAEAAGRDPGEILRAASLSLEDDARHDRPARSTSGSDAGFGYLVCGWPGQGRGPSRGVRAAVPAILSRAGRARQSGLRSG